MGNRAQITVRVFGRDDLAAVEHLILTTIDAAYHGAYPDRAIAYFKRLHRSEGILARRREGIVLVVESEGEIVGTGSLVGGEIGGVFIRTDMQGLGIGTLVMDELETLAAAAGLESVSLCVSLPSRGFYERRGYVLGELLSGDMGEGQTLDYWEGHRSVPRGGS